MFSVQRILVPVDFSVTSRAAISLGIQLAHRYEAKLYFLHTERELEGDLKDKIVSSPRQNAIEGEIADNERVLKEYVEVEYERAQEGGKPVNKMPAEYLILGGNWLGAALQLIKDEEIDLVISATHGPQGVKGFFMGTATEKLLKNADCSVFVVKPQGYPYLRD